LADEELSFLGRLSTYQEQKMRRLGLFRMTEMQCFGSGPGGSPNFLGYGLRKKIIISDVDPTFLKK
jgi:hypothetical protein